jgi:hypothetical protein
MNHVKRRIEISLLCGIGLTLALTFLSSLAVRLFPYRDLPMMPKPLFLLPLLPGATFGELLSGWLRYAVFYIANSVVYAFFVFCTIAIMSAVRRTERDRSQ